VRDVQLPTLPLQEADVMTFGAKTPSTSTNLKTDSQNYNCQSKAVKVVQMLNLCNRDKSI